jgi:hypothetical protein
MQRDVYDQMVGRFFTFVSRKTKVRLVVHTVRLVRSVMIAPPRNVAV